MLVRNLCHVRTSLRVLARDRIVETIKTWKEVDGFSRIVTGDEIAATDYNVAPSRYIQDATNGDYRPIGEILDELELLEAEGIKATSALHEVVRSLSGVSRKR
jgi:type I restriction enzyme M protein